MTYSARPFRGRWVLVTALLAIPLLIGGWAILRDHNARASQQAIESHDGVQGLVAELATERPDGVYQLAEVTDWEWDRVSVFPEGATRGEVLAESGLDLGAGKLLDADDRVLGMTLVVFTLNGEVVKAVDIRPEALFNTPGKWTYDYPGYVANDLRIGPLVMVSDATPCDEPAFTDAMPHGCE